MRYIFVYILLAFISNKMVFSQKLTNDSINEDVIKLYSTNLDELLAIELSSATKFDEKIKDIPTSVYIVTRKDIQTYGYRTLSEILQHVPGFYIMDDYTMYKENIGVRGFYRSEWNQNIIFLVNGVRQRSGYDFNNKLSYINVPVQSIQRVEVIKGPAAVSYGSGAFFGVVNIVTTEQESSSSNSTDFSLGLGTQKTSQINFNSSKKVDGYLLGVNLGGQMSDGIEQNFKNISGDTSLSTKRFMNEKSAYFGFYLQKKHLFTTLTFDKSWNNRTVVSPPYVSKLHESSSSFLAARYLLRYFTKYKELIDFNASYNYQHQQEELEFDLVGLDYNQEYQNTTVG